MLDGTPVQGKPAQRNCNRFSCSGSGFIRTSRELLAKERRGENPNAVREWCASLPTPKPVWRNWQTRRAQNAVSVRTCGFDSHGGYLYKTLVRVTVRATSPHGAMDSAASFYLVGSGFKSWWGRLISVRPLTLFTRCVTVKLRAVEQLGSSLGS